MQAEGGAAGFVDIVARLLGATFGGPIAGYPRPRPEAHRPHHARSPGGTRRPRPFPWGEVMAAGLGLLRLRPPTSGP